MNTYAIILSFNEFHKKNSNEVYHLLLQTIYSTFSSYVEGDYDMFQLHKLLYQTQIRKTNQELTQYINTDVNILKPDMCKMIKFECDKATAFNISMLNLPIVSAIIPLTQCMSEFYITAYNQ